MYTSDHVSAGARYGSLLDEIHQEFPTFRIVRKDESRLQRAIDLALRTLTAGKMTSYLTRYQTTIGTTVYVSADWDDRSDEERYVTMRHERVHLRQFARLTLPVMAVLYLLVPVPMGLAWCRARLEWAAYRETIVAAAEVHGPGYVRAPRFRAAIIDQFTGPAYGWMWPIRRDLERWYDEALETGR